MSSIAIVNDYKGNFSREVKPVQRKWKLQNTHTHTNVSAETEIEPNRVKNQ